MSDLTKLAAQTPLIDLLRGVPADARMTYEVNPTHHHMIPVGRLCADAVADLSNLAAELANVIADYDAAAYAMAALKQQNDSLRARQAVLVEALTGWSFEPSTKHGIQYMTIEAPNGYSAHVASHAMNPANILYMLAAAIRGAKE